MDSIYCNDVECRIAIHAPASSLHRNIADRIAVAVRELARFRVLPTKSLANMLICCKPGVRMVVCWCWATSHVLVAECTYLGHAAIQIDDVYIAHAGGMAGECDPTTDEPLMTLEGVIRIKDGPPASAVLGYLSGHTDIIGVMFGPIIGQPAHEPTGAPTPSKGHAESWYRSLLRSATGEG